MSLYENHLNLDLIINIRNFNHIKTRDNTKLKPDSIYRSATPDFGSSHDFTVLKALNLDLFIDLRSEAEKNTQRAYSFDENFPRKAMPIDVGDFISRQSISDLKNIHSVNEIKPIFISLYEAFPVYYQHVFKEIFGYLQAGKKIAYHCTAGKDRTGIASYLILSTLNVSEDDIMENYLESNNYANRLADLLKNELKGIDPEFYAQLQLIYPDYLSASIQVIKEQYGGIEAYLRNVLKVDIDLIRNNYLR